MSLLKYPELYKIPQTGQIFNTKVNGNFIAGLSFPPNSKDNFDLFPF
jgi:hypothetical protein